MQAGEDEIQNKAVVGEPLIGVAAQADKFEIQVDARKFFYTAASHRPLIRSIRITNRSWHGDDEEIHVSIHSETVGASSLIHPKVVAYPAIGIGDVLDVEVNQIRPNLVQLASLNGSVIGDIVVQVKIGGQVMAEHRQVIEFLAYNQWFHDKLDYDCISAFVFPSHPVVAKIMEDVRGRLFTETGDGSTGGYQCYGSEPLGEAGKKRVRLMLKAIYDELSGLGLEYSNPPASFEGYGQKIRTPDVIMQEKVATCLDSALLSASCIAAAGLSPLVFLVRGHAFPGAWTTKFNYIDPDLTLENNILRPTTLSNPNDFQQFVSLGLISSFESTQICRSLAKPFDVAEGPHVGYSKDPNVREFEAIVDVERSSSAGVRSLPNRRLITAGHEAEILVDRSPIEALRPTGYEVSDSPDPTEVNRLKLSVGDVPLRVRRWMDALLDISNSNPLINLNSAEVFIGSKGAAGRRSIQIPMPQGLLADVENRMINGDSIKAVCIHRMPGVILNDPTAENIRQYFHAQGTLSIGNIALGMGLIDYLFEENTDDGLPPKIARSKANGEFEQRHEAETSKRFRSLKKLADDTESESATNQLFMTIGSLVWESPGEAGRGAKIVKSPLYLIPVRISGSAASSFSIVIEEGGEITPNYCLVEKIRSELGLQFSELETPNLDDSGIDVNNAIASIRRQLSSSKHATIRVEEDCQLAVLDFATFRMWKDIRANWQLFSKNEVVAHLIDGSNDTLQQNLPPFTGELLTPFDCDESQLQAVQWALEGRSFVLEGPPGTGKSQTIANLIAASVAEGKRVLFVAEKQIALEAVSSKLEEVGLDPFCITMHHESTTPESIRQQLKVSLDFVGEDISQQWASETSVVASLKLRLDRYRDALIEKNKVGQNALLAQQEVLRLGEGPALDVHGSTLIAIGENIDELRSAFIEIRNVVGASRVDQNIAWFIVENLNSTTIPREQISTSIHDLKARLNALVHLRVLIEPLLETATKASLSAVNKDAMSLMANSQLRIPISLAQDVVKPSWLASLDVLTGQVKDFKAVNDAVLGLFNVAAFSMDLSPQMQAASDAISAGMLSRKKKYVILKNLLTHIARVEITQPATELLTLLQRVRPTSDGIQKLKDQYLATSHLSIRQDFDPLNNDHIQEVTAASQDLVERARKLLHPEANAVRTVIENGTIIDPGDADSVENILELWWRLKSLLCATSESVLRWRNGLGIWDVLANSLEILALDAPNFPTLVKVARINETLQPLRRAGQSELADSIRRGEVGLDDIYKEFERGVAKSSRSERLSTEPLVNFDKVIFDKTVSDFVRKDRVCKELMQVVIPRRLADSRPFKSGIRTGQIGNLEKELGRKVRRVSVPRLIKEHGEMITRLAPCFLMSPEAVSRLLPADSQYFDIVVFDEASQIRVAAAIPAMGRGKSVIIVGDSQQMPPSREIGKKMAAGSDDGAFDPEGVYQDLESILSECSESHLPSLMLKCHYRSQHEGLIAFSNRNFYENSLTTFPAPDTDKWTPVEWFDVPTGQFMRKGDEKGTNPEEAKAVVAEIRRRLNDPAHASKSIGVVTFNEYQAELITELLNALIATDKAIAAALLAPNKRKRLFVVPLERVQGDERDTIILSVSYSYQGDNRNKVSPTWGPLTNKGGERRLNVAITRAKQNLLIFCSFDPSHVDDTSATHKGIPYTVSFLKECRDAGRTRGGSLKLREVSAKDHHRRRLFDLLRSSSIQVRENIGLSRFRIDLGVKSENDQQFLAILLDGEEWAGRTTPFDRDVLPNFVLQNIGWRRIGRVWLKSVVEDPIYVLKIVQNEIAREGERLKLVAELESRGYEVRSDASLARIGIDMALRRQGQAYWPLAIAISGPDLFRQYFHFEGDLPTTEILQTVRCIEAMSVWMPDLTSSPVTALDRIEQQFEQSASNIDESSEIEIKEPVKVDDAIAAKNMDASAERPILIDSEYRTEFVDSASLPMLGDQTVLGPGNGFNPSLVRRAIDEVVHAEGPITQSRLASIVVGRFGMRKVKKARLESMKKQFKHLTKTRSKFGVVYWPDNRPADSWLGFRTCSGEITRDLDDVPVEELSNAMVAVVRLGDSAFSEQILRHVAQAFGKKAMTKRLTDLLSEILEVTVKSGRLVVESGLYRMPNQ